MKLLITILALSLSGCAAQNFSHPNKNQADFSRDLYECDMIATQYMANMGFRGEPFAIRQQTIKCLEIKHGWKAD